MKRRDFMAGVAAAVLMIWPGVGRAQQSQPEGAASVKNPFDSKEKQKMNQK